MEAIITLGRYGVGTIEEAWRVVAIIGGEGGGVTQEDASVARGGGCGAEEGAGPEGTR